MRPGVTSMMRARPWAESVMTPAWLPVNERAWMPRLAVAIATRAIEMRSPLVSSMSSSRAGGSGLTCSARSSSSSVVSPMAETTTTTRARPCGSRRCGRRTRLTPSASATEEPPYFCTTRPNSGTSCTSGAAGGTSHDGGAAPGRVVPRPHQRGDRLYRRGSAAPTASGAGGSAHGAAPADHRPRLRAGGAGAPRPAVGRAAEPVARRDPGGAAPRHLRHVVRFVRLQDTVAAVKENTEELVRREYGLLRVLRRWRCRAWSRSPSSRALQARRRGARPGAGDPAPAVLAALPRAVQPVAAADTATRLVDSLAVLLVRLHLAGFYWGDVSLSNTLFRRDAGEFAAYLVDAETGELHNELSDGQRSNDVEVARINIAGELM